MKEPGQGTKGRGQWRHRAMPLLAFWWLTPWAVPHRPRCTGRCSSWPRLPYGTMRQQHTHISQRSWKDALEKVILRARPGHQQPREGRAWTWIFANKETAEIKDDLVIEKLMLVRCKKIFFAPLHSQGGPTVKFIRKMAQQTKSRGDDGGVDVQQLYRNWNADDV